jgi:hypothetical protein
MKKILHLFAALLSLSANAYYLSGTNQSIEAVMGAAVNTTAPFYTVSWQDVTSAGMTIPQSSTQGTLNGLTDVTITAAPSASTTRQIAHINIYNSDAVAVTVYVMKDDGGTEYTLVKAQLNPGNTLQWSRDGGWSIVNETSDPAYIIQEYITSGTWNKPAGIKAALLVAVGAGGGGGSGRRGPTTTNRFGGGGGGGGAMVWYFVPGTSLSSTMAVTVGAGGTGGAAVTTNNTAGNAGTAGGDTNIGGIVIAKGGAGGGGGSTTAGTAGTGGQANVSTPNYGPYAIVANAGSAGVTTGTATSAVGLNGSVGCTGGAGGRGIDNANTSGTGVLTISGTYVNGSIQGATTTPGAAGKNDLALSLFFNNAINGSYGIGSAGNGGAVASAGGNGGRGCGGGGGGGSLDGTDSGKGGDGGGGLAKILEIY